jgi:hypothetical protein
MTDATLTRGQRQTQKARETYAAQFKSPKERTEHYQQLGRQSANARVTLTREEADAVRQALPRLDEALPALHEAYAFLRSIAPKLEKSNQPDESAA